MAIMVGKLVIVFAFVFVVTQVTCLTNQEFVDILRDHGDDVEETIYTDDVDDDAITLPGGPDDEIDVEDVLLQLLPDFEEEIKPDSDDRSVTWWKKKKRHHRPRPKICHCHKYGCKCCITKSFKVVFKRFTFNLTNLLGGVHGFEIPKLVRFVTPRPRSGRGVVARAKVFQNHEYRPRACVEIDYMPRNYGFRLRVWFNGRQMFLRQISLTRPPGLCFGIPFLKKFARACLEIYNVNIARKSLCVRVTGVINLLFKKFSLHLKIACFKIPLLDEIELNKHLLDPENWALDSTDDSSSHVNNFMMLKASDEL